MKTLQLSLLIILLLVAGCVTAEKIHVPPQDSYWFDSYLGVMRMCPEGMFDEENRGKAWYTEEDYNKMLEEMEEEMEKDERKRKEL